MTIEKAKELLGDSVNNLSDEEIQDYINMIRVICNLVIEEYIQDKDSK